MKQIKFIIGFLVGSVLFGSVGVYAGGNQTEIKAFLNHEITIDINNETWRPEKPDGEVLTPILYENRAYVPLRAFAKRFNFGINYSEATKYDGGKIDISMDDDDYSEPFFGNALQNNMSMEEINKILGKPIKTEPIDFFGKGIEGLSLTYNNGDVIDYHENYAWFMHIKSKLIKTSRGIQVGSKLEEVNRKYGNLSDGSDGDNSELSYVYGRGHGLYINFYNNIVVEFGTWGEYDYSG